MPPTPVRNDDSSMASILYRNVSTPAASQAASSSRMAARYTPKRRRSSQATSPVAATIRASAM